MLIRESLQTLSLDSLVQLLAQSNEQLLESKNENKDIDMTNLYQTILDRIQNAIVIKRAELPPMK